MAIYIISGALGGLFVGASFLTISSLHPRKPLSVDETKTLEININEDEIRFSEHSEPQKLSNSPTKEIGSINALVACGLLSACLFFCNFRFYQVWKSKIFKKKIDAEKFQRAFDRFMNEERFEKEWESFQEKKNFDRESAKEWEKIDREFKERFRRQREFREKFEREHKNWQGKNEELLEPDRQIQNALKELGISKEDAKTESLLHSAYLRAAQRWHPDKWPDNQRPQATEAFKRAGAAYARLRAAFRPTRSAR